MTEEQLYIEIDRAITDPTNRQNTAGVVRAVLKLIVKNARQWITEVVPDVDNINLENYYNKQQIDILLSALQRVGLDAYRLTLTPGATVYELPDFIIGRPRWIDVIGPTNGPYTMTALDFDYDSTTHEISGWHYEDTEGEDPETGIPADTKEFLIWYNNGGNPGNGGGSGTRPNTLNATAISSTQVALTWN